MLALEVTSGVAGAAGEPLCRVASRGGARSGSAVVRTEIVHRFDEESGSVRAVRAGLATTGSSSPSGRSRRTRKSAAGLLAEALERSGLGEAGERLRRRLRFAGLEADLHAAVIAACRGRTRLPPLDEPEQWLDAGARARLDATGSGAARRCRAAGPRRSSIARTAPCSPR